MFFGRHLICLEFGHALRKGGNGLWQILYVAAGDVCSSMWFFLSKASRCNSASASASVRTAGLPMRARDGAAIGRWAIPTGGSSDWLNEGQRAAVRHVLGSRDRVAIIRGVAGTGKTTLEQELGEALAEAGRPVVAWRRRRKRAGACCVMTRSSPMLIR